MRRAAALLVLLVLAGCAGSGSSGSSSGGSAKDSDACFEVGDAVLKYQDFADGLHAGTLTKADMASSLKSIASKLSDAALLTPANVAQMAKRASIAAGQLRVVIVNEDVDAVEAKAGALQSQMVALDSACS